MKDEGFDRVAKIYDALALLVFGRSISHAQLPFLNHIRAGEKVVIIGGGTGWILEHIKSPCEIWYVEKSSAMIERSRKRNTIHTIHFIHGTTADLQHIEGSVVITHFFLDLFEGDSLRAEVNRISALIRPGGTWLVSDFVDEKWWHRAMLTVMYSFFRLTRVLHTRALPDWEAALDEAGWSVKSEMYFFQKFMKSQLRRRQ